MSVAKVASKKAPKNAPKTTVAGVPKKAAKRAVKAVKTAPETSKGKEAPRRAGRPAGSVKREIHGIEVFKTFNFDRPDAKVLVGGLRRVVIEAGPDGAKQLAKLATMVEKNDKKLRDLLG